MPPGTSKKNLEGPHDWRLVAALAKSLTSPLQQAYNRVVDIRNQNHVRRNQAGFRSLFTEG